MLRLLLVLVAALFAAACAPVANGELERQLNFTTNNCLTQVPDREDFRTFRQKTPSFLLP